MSPAKQKSNERQAARDRKALARQVTPSGGIGANAYNPSSGTFHTLESVSSDIGSAYLSGKFKTIDESDDPNGGGTEFECMSNNDSCSGESEDQPHANVKEKHLVGKSVGGGSDKRDKIRGKNERKHQRQRERRAQELRDKCSGYLMSRKLESLSQQLVAMGFSQERATMALIFNDGHVEQSVAWLLEGGEGQVAEDWNTGGNPKIDISDELGRIAEIEKKCKFSRADIERSIVSFEGDLDKALDFLRVKAQNTPSACESEKVQSDLKEVPAAMKEFPSRSRSRSRSPSPSATPTPHNFGQQRLSNGLQPMHQARKDMKCPIYLKPRQQMNMASHHTSDVPSKGLSHAKNHPVADLHSLLPAADNSNDLPKVTSVIYRTSPTYEAPLYNASILRPDTPGILNIKGPDSKFAGAPSKESFVNSRAKNLIGAVLSPPGVLQVSAAVTTCPVSSSNFPPPNWNCGFKDLVAPSSALFGDSALGDIQPVPTVGKKAVDTQSAGVANAGGYPSSVVCTPLDAQWPWIDNVLPTQNSLGQSLSPVHSTNHSRNSLLTSYGLFTGWGSAGTSSVDWSTGPMVHCDYRNIDWSMSVSPSTTIEGGRRSVRGLSSSLKSLKIQEKGNHTGWSLEEELLGTTHFIMESTTTMAMNSGGFWNGGMPSSGAVGMQDNAHVEPLGSTAAFGVHEWTSPFAGKDLFKLPQAVPSPSL